MNEPQSTKTHDCNMCQHITSLILSMPSDSISMSCEIDKLAGALVKATGEMGFIKKDKGGAERGGKKIYYADINAVLEESKPNLMKHGITLLQPLFTDSKGFHRIGSFLLHESGQFISSSMVIEAHQDNMQQFGGYITYARRYACVSMLGIAQEDNDAAPVFNGNNAVPAKPVYASNGTKLATDAQVGFVGKLVSECANAADILKAIYTSYSISKLSELKIEDVNDVISYIKTHTKK